MQRVKVWQMIRVCKYHRKRIDERWFDTDYGYMYGCSVTEPDGYCCGNDGIRVPTKVTHQVAIPTGLTLKQITTFKAEYQRTHGLPAGKLCLPDEQSSPTEENRRRLQKAGKKDSLELVRPQVVELLNEYLSKDIVSICVKFLFHAQLV